MAKIATDISQSKKLAKILPIESADMMYVKNTNLIPMNGCFDIELDSPAWSVSALMDIIPNCGVVKNELGLYKCECYYPFFTNVHNHAVDACVEIIIKLKKRNLL